MEAAYLDQAMCCWSAEGLPGSIMLDFCDLPLCRTSFRACRGSMQRLPRSRDVVGVHTALSASPNSMDPRTHVFLELHARELR